MCQKIRSLNSRLEIIKNEHHLLFSTEHLQLMLIEQIE